MAGLPIPSGWASCPPGVGGGGGKKRKRRAPVASATVLGEISRILESSLILGGPPSSSSAAAGPQRQQPRENPREQQQQGGGGPPARRTRLEVVEEEEDDALVGPAVCLVEQQRRDVSRQSQQQGGGGALEAIRSAIQAAKTFDSRAKLAELNLDTVLSSTSYRSLMRQVFGGGESIIPGDSASRQGGGAPVRVPTVTRAYEEGYMREPLQHERECARGPRCECMSIDPMHPFVAVEFLTIDEMKDPPRDSQLCVICSRKETQYLYYDMVFNKSVYNSVIQRFGNVSGANEYATECLLRCTRSADLACMPKPIMSHQRNRYLVRRHPELGVLCLRQVRVSPHDHVSSMSLENPLSLRGDALCSGAPSAAAAGAPRVGKNRGF